MKRPTVSEAVAQAYARLNAEWEVRKKPRKRRMGALIKQVETHRQARQQRHHAGWHGAAFRRAEPTEASNPWLADLKVTKQ